MTPEEKAIADLDANPLAAEIMKHLSEAHFELQVEMREVRGATRYFLSLRDSKGSRLGTVDSEDLPQAMLCLAANIKRSLNPPEKFA